MRQKFDEIHEIYIRMAELTERLLEHPRFREVATDPNTGELLGSLAAIGQDALKLSLRLRTIRARGPLAFPGIWKDIAGWEIPLGGS